MDVTFRLADVADTPRILEIYRPYVEDMVVSFEYVAPDPEQFKARIGAIMRVYPCIVAEQDGSIIGYAYATRHHERAAYDWSANLSVYLCEENTSRGLGTRLYTGLIELLKLQNVQNVYGLIVDSNGRSLAFHKRMGFQRVGQYHSVGYKMGDWHNVSVYELPIGEHPNPPQPFIELANLDNQAVSAVLAAL